ncbi:hypothetical protein L7F22_023514 [Adiantum nelumboides]|nr:hypothetical protein [Adiantum nelumboides]
MDEDNGSPSPKLDLNQAVSNDNDDEMKEERQEEDASGEAAQNASNHAAGNGSSLKVPSPARDGGSLPREEAVESPIDKALPSPARRTPSPPLKQSDKGSRSPSPKRRQSSPARRSRSPEEKRRRSRSPEGRHSRRRDDGRRRHDRSRSPVTRSNHRERSRSWSPRDRDRHRSSRRRSSPPRYLSRGDRSPRKRPWSPPRNRITGLGKPGNHLFVAGFSFATTERDLEKKFGRYGRVSDVRIIRDRRSGDSRGFGFLSLERDEEADAAIEGLDQTEWNGRIVLVEKAKTT